MARLDSSIRVDVLQRPLVVYRGCHGSDAGAVRDAMRSNYETGRSPHPADLRATVLHMAVSMFEADDVLLRLARRRPDRVGTHVARLELQPERGICLADTGSAGHWSVWGIPEQLAECVVDVEPVRKGPVACADTLKPMTYSIFDTGNLVVSFDREDEAYEALERLARERQDAADGLLLVAFDDAGSAIADCVPGERIVSAA